MLACVERGDESKPAVVFLHGFLGSGGDWAEVVEGLGDEFRCLMPDLPGHGHSTSIAVAGLDGAARDVLGLLDDRRVERCSLVGYSMGGRLGLYLTIRHPERIRCAVIESASPGLRSEEERVPRRRQDEAVAQELESGVFEGFLRRWYAQPLFASLHRDAGRFEALLRRRLENEPQALAPALRALGTGCQPALWEELAGCGVHLLFVAGGLDVKYSAIAREMAAICPRGEARIVDGCGHNVHFEDPSGYTRLLLEILGEL